MVPWAAAFWGDPNTEFPKGSGEEDSEPSSRAQFLNHNFWHARRDVTNFSKPLLECPAQVSSREPPKYCPTKGMALLELLVGALWDTVSHWGEAQGCVGRGILGDRAGKFSGFPGGLPNSPRGHAL